MARRYSDSIAPTDALDRLRGLSSEVRAAVIVDAEGTVLDRCGEDDESGSVLGEAAPGFVEAARQAAPRHGMVAREVEVVTARGALFGLLEDDWALVVAAPRYALASLMLMDMRRAVALPTASV